MCNGIPLHGEHDFPEGAAPDWKRQLRQQTKFLKRVFGEGKLFSENSARCKFSERLFNRMGIAWIDNESAKYSCVKGTSTSFSMQALCRVMQQLEIERPSTMWYERVASHSNPGDLPSRQQVEQASALFNATVEAAWVPPQIWWMQSSCSMRIHMVLSTQ